MRQRIDYNDGLHDHDSDCHKLGYEYKDVENLNQFQQQLCGSVWKESKEQKRQSIDLLLFPKQKEQKKEALQQEMKEELRLEKGIRIQEDEDTVSGGSGAVVDANYVNKGKLQQEIKLQVQIQE